MHAEVQLVGFGLCGQGSCGDLVKTLRSFHRFITEVFAVCVRIFALWINKSANQPIFPAKSEMKKRVDFLPNFLLEMLEKSLKTASLKEFEQQDLLSNERLVLEAVRRDASVEMMQTEGVFLRWNQGLERIT